MTDAASYLRRISDEIVRVQKPIRILKALNWDPSVHARFFKRQARELPDPSYLPLGYDPAQKIKELVAIRRRIRGQNPVEELLKKKCDEFVLVVRMLAARGTRRFHELSVELYGSPASKFTDRRVDNREIARLWAQRPAVHRDEGTVDSAHAAEIIREICRPHLGDHATVKESRRLTANAAAGATHVAIRSGAAFTPRQARALAHHEGLWHVLTSLNGYRQPVLTVLGVGLPRFTESQEGGGIVAEFLTGNIADDRFAELGERTIAVDMAMRGADFLQTYDYLASRFPSEKAALMCERVFRGGVLTGGAPFTKDSVYQRGYCRVFNFLRHAMENGDTSLVQAFLAGKMNVEDAFLVRELIAEGLCNGPMFVPEWYRDLDRLAGEVTHSLTMDQFDLARVHKHYQRLIERRWRQKQRAAAAAAEAVAAAAGALHKA